MSLKSARPERDGIYAIPVGAWRDRVLSTLIVAVCALLGMPFSRTLAGDDATFAYTALMFAKTGHLVFTGWAAMTEGWLIPWGALFIKLFGFSAPSLYWSTILAGLVAVYVFHGVLLRFGISRSGALLGTLVLGASPLYLPVLVSYMTDAPGVLSLVVCAAMCQRAVLAKSDRNTCLWLIAAAAMNLVDGSVRQVCWLGAMVMVPATGWLLRRRRNAWPVGAASGAMSAVAVWLALRWYYTLPYTFPEKLVAGPIRVRELVRFGTNWVGAVLLMLLLVAPVAAAWAWKTNGLSRMARWRIGAGMAVVALGLAGLWRHPVALAKCTVPWLEPVLEGQGMPRVIPGQTYAVTLNLPTRAAMTVLVVGLGLVILEHLMRFARMRAAERRSPEARAMFWILVPYTAAYSLALTGRAAFVAIQDRYVLMILPAVLVGMLYFYETELGKRLPSASTVVLVAMMMYGVGGLHTLQSETRAIERLDRRLTASGVDRREISEGMGEDFAAQLAYGGHINNVAVKNPASAFTPNVPKWHTPVGCEINYDPYVPLLHARYFLGGNGAPGCFKPAGFVPEPYTAWLPPFHREMYVLESAHAGGAGIGKGGEVEGGALAAADGVGKHGSVGGGGD